MYLQILAYLQERLVYNRSLGSSTWLKYFLSFLKSSDAYWLILFLFLTFFILFILFPIFLSSFILFPIFLSSFIVFILFPNFYFIFIILEIF